MVSAASRSRSEASANRKTFERWARTTASKTMLSGATDDDVSMAAASSIGLESIKADCKTASACRLKLVGWRRTAGSRSVREAAAAAAKTTRAGS